MDFQENTAECLLISNSCWTKVNTLTSRVALWWLHQTPSALLYMCLNHLLKFNTLEDATMTSEIWIVLWLPWRPQVASIQWQLGPIHFILNYKGNITKSSGREQACCQPLRGDMKVGCHWITKNNYTKISWIWKKIRIFTA